MNKLRREELMEVAGILDDVICRLSDIQSDEQEYFDNMPEGFQYGARGDAAQEAIDLMDEWVSDIEEIKTNIEDYAGG